MILPLSIKLSSISPLIEGAIRSILVFLPHFSCTSKCPKCPKSSHAARNCTYCISNHYCLTPFLNKPFLCALMLHRCLIVMALFFPLPKDSTFERTSLLLISACATPEVYNNSVFHTLRPSLHSSSLQFYFVSTIPFPQTFNEFVRIHIYPCCLGASLLVALSAL